jgi:hypothetical protein
MKTCGGEVVSSTVFGPQHKLEVSGQLHTSAVLPPGKELLVPTG